MVKFVVVGKFGESKTLNVLNLNLEELYKKCKFRKKDYFSKRHTWKVKKDDKYMYIHLYAKDVGRPATINKFELPPPIDKDLFYGTLGIVASNDKDCTEMTDFTHQEWEKVYIALMGGFEDLDSEEGERSSDEYIPPDLKTKQGYSKENNFIVDDDAIEFLSSEEPSEDEYEFEDDEDTTSNTDGECLGMNEDSSNKSGDDNVQEEDGGNEAADDGEDEEDDNDNDGDDEFEQGDSELTEEEYVKEN